MSGSSSNSSSSSSTERRPSITVLRSSHMQNAESNNTDSSAPTEQKPEKQQPLRRSSVTVFDLSHEKISTEGAIYKAIEADDSKQVEAILAENKQACDEQHATLDTTLHAAVTRGNKEIVALIAKTITDPNVPDKDGATPLHLSVATNQWDIIPILNEANQRRKAAGMLPINAALKDNFGKTPFTLSGFCRDMGESTRKILEEMANESLAEDNIYDAIKQRDVAKAQNLFRDNNEIYDARNAEECTTLHCAVRNFKPNLTIILDAAKYIEDPNVQDLTNKATPLHYAIRTGNPEIVKMLDSANKIRKLDGRKKLIDINLKDCYGQTPYELAVACFPKDRAIAELIEKMAKGVAPLAQAPIATPTRPAVLDTLPQVKPIVSAPASSAPTRKSVVDRPGGRFFRNVMESYAALQQGSVVAVEAPEQQPSPAFFPPIVPVARNIQAGKDFVVSPVNPTSLRRPGLQQQQTTATASDIEPGIISSEAQPTLQAMADESQAAITSAPSGEAPPLSYAQDIKYPQNTR